MSRHPFVVEPYTEECRTIYEEREHVVVGVSPGNSYFGVDLLAELLAWLCQEFRQVDVVVPDSGLVHTYLALGYPGQKAAKKARAETNVLFNRVVRGWEKSGGPRAGDGVHRMSELETGIAYQRLLRRCGQALADDPKLRATALRMCRDSLRARRPEFEPTLEQVECSMQYLLAELPFFLCSADIFEVSSSLCFYHQVVPLADDIFAKRTGLRASYRQGYAVIHPKDFPEHHESRSRV
ncbi:tRNA-dependent cyclodipeptide synthase [Streptomyces griseocarneus]|nr:tRNA-dependent cyclodipeptide synthase [Streptomyces griseocarneus]